MAFEGVVNCQLLVASENQRLSLQVLGAFDIDRREVVVEVEEDGQGDGGFGGGQDNHEYGKHLAGEGSGIGIEGETIERDEVDVGGVEDQLNTHQDTDGVALDEDGEDAADEKDRAEHQI